MRRGITPVVAIALLLGMTVAASGGAYTFVSQAQQGAQDDATSALATEVAVRGLRCDDASVEVTLKNTGDTSLTDTAVDAYLYRDGTLVTTAEKDIAGANVLEPNGLSTVSLPFVLEPGARYTVELRFPDSDLQIEDTCQARLSSLVGYWDFESKVPGEVRDAAGSNDGTYENNERDGTLNGFDFGPGSGWVTGRVGPHALRFDGQDDYVQVPADDAFNTKSATVAMWVKAYPGQLQNDSWLLKHLGSDSQLGWMGTSRLNLEHRGCQDSDYSPITLDSAMQTGEWYHIAAVWDYANSEGSIYVDGAVEGTVDIGASCFANTTGALRVGDDAWTSDGENFDGEIDAVSFFNRPLSASEVADLYGGAEVRDGLMGEWTFDEGNGTTAHDTSKWTNGTVGEYALEFDGSDDHAVVPSDTTLDFGSGGFTIMLWSKLGAYDPGNLPSYRHYITRASGEVYHSNDGPGWGIYWATTTGNEICFGMRDSGTSGTNVCSGSSPNDGQWHFIAARRNGSERALFVDGTWYKSGGVWYDDPTGEDLEIHGDGRYVEAVSDDIRVYDTALSDEQVASYYAATD